MTVSTSLVGTSNLSIEEHEQTGPHMKEESSPSNETSLHGRDGETCDGVYWKTEVTEAGVGDHQTGPSRAVI